MRGTKMDEGRYSLMDRFQRLGGILNWKEVVWRQPQRASRIDLDVLGAQ